LEDEISRLVNSRKQLEADASLKKKNVMDKRKDLQSEKKRNSIHTHQLSLKTSCFSTTFQPLSTMVVSLMV
jgi:hypothetical protein